MQAAAGLQLVASVGLEPAWPLVVPLGEVAGLGKDPVGSNRSVPLGTPSFHPEGIGAWPVTSRDTASGWPVSPKGLIGETVNTCHPGHSPRSWGSVL